MFYRQCFLGLLNGQGASMIFLLFIFKVITTCRKDSIALPSPHHEWKLFEIHSFDSERERKMETFTRREVIRSWEGWCKLVLTREIVLYIIYTVKVNVADPRSRSSTEIRVSSPRHSVWMIQKEKTEYRMKTEGAISRWGLEEVQEGEQADLTRQVYEKVWKRHRHETSEPE